MEESREPTTPQANRTHLQGTIFSQLRKVGTSGTDHGGCGVEGLSLQLLVSISGNCICWVHERCSYMGG